MNQHNPTQAIKPVTFFLFLMGILLSIQTFGQPIISANLGVNLAGDLEFRRGGYGLSVGYLKNKFGLEFEIMRHQHFFKDSAMMNYIKDPKIDMNTDAILYTLNFLYFVRLENQKRLHPVLSAGAGIYHSWFDAINYLSPPSSGQTTLNLSFDTLDTKQNNIGFHLGAGVMYELKNKKLRLRSEFRYSYALAKQDKSTGAYFEDFGFLRFSVGISYLFLQSHY